MGYKYELRVTLKVREWVGECGWSKRIDGVQ